MTIRRSQRPPRPIQPRGRRQRAGRAPVGGLLWTFAVCVFALPFLRQRDGVDPEVGDFGRTEADETFEARLAAFEAEYPDVALRAALEEATAERFDPGSRGLRDSGVVEVGRLADGGRAYATHCIGCHGTSGDGGGPAARYLAPRPRNFRPGTFKFTSTDAGQRPMRRDLFQTITRGLAGSAMPEFRLLSEEVRWNLVEYVRFLGLRGEFQETMLAVAIDEEELPDADEVAEIVLRRWHPDHLSAVYPGAPETERDAASVERGRALFVDVARGNCAACHGAGGKGDGPNAGDYVDDWGYPIRPRDFTGGVFRAGSEGVDLYRTIAVGIKGTPMPSFAGALSAEEIWDLVHFVQSLEPERRAGS